MLAQTHDPPWWAYVVFLAILLTMALVAKRGGAIAFARLLEHDGIARGCGFGLVLLGLFFGYLIVYQPLVDTIARKQQVLVHRGTVGVMMIFVFVGMTFLFSGKQWKRFLLSHHGHPMTSLQKATYFTGVIVCLGCEFGFWGLLHLLGYKRLL